MLLCAAALCSCSKILPERIELTGRTEVMSLPVSDFNEINVSSAVSVIISDAVSEIMVETDAALMDYIIVAQNGNKLRVGYPSNITWKGESVNRVTIPSEYAQLNSIHASGASVVEVNDPICSRRLDVRLSGASVLYATSHANTIEMELSGSSHAYFNGEAETLKVYFSGASGLHSKLEGGQYALDVTNVIGSISGSSSLDIHSDGKIDVSLSGASSLWYTGRADVSKCSCSGASSVNKGNTISRY